MNKKAKILTIMIILNLIITISIGLFKNESNATSQSRSTDINSLNDGSYPGIKSMINSLKSTHPNWNFKILYTDIEWKDAITYESTGHKEAPKNLVQGNSSSYSGSWICPICGNGVYDNGSWNCASESALKYMMDARNSLNSSDIFQFLELSYDNSYNYDSNVVASILSGSFLNSSTYINVLMDACRQYGANPYYIVARIIQEQGKYGTTLVSGDGYNGNYVGYYNIFNIGANGNGTDAIIENGLKKAQSYGWTSLELSLRGGIKVICESYISKGQDTMYLQKFDVDNSDGNLYWHQYMQNILAAQNEGTTLRKALSNKGAIDYPYTFVIPVYKNMPSTACSRPSTSSTCNTIETDLVSINVNEKIKMRNESNGSTIVGYVYSGEIATRLARATEKVNGVYWDKVMKNNGTVGYIARSTSDSESEYKLYLIQLNNDNNYSGNKSSDDSKDNTSSVKKGDANGDETIDSADLLYVKKYLLNKISLNDTEKSASDVNGDGTIDSADLLTIKKYLLGKITL